MKRYTTYIISTAAISLMTLLFAACSADEVVKTGNREGEIRFRVGDNDKWITRADLVTDQTTIQAKTISLSAVFSDDNQTLYLDDKELSYKSSSWEFGDSKYYWPPRNLSFYAYLPYGDTNITDVSENGGLKYASAGTTFTYTVPKENSGQKDLMYAVVKNQQKTGNDIPLYFKHALAAVSFLANTESSNMTVKISGIDFVNVSTSGTFTYPASSTAASPTGDHADCWSGLNDADNTLKAGVTPITLSTTEQQVNTADGVLMLIPQTLTAWDQASDATAQGGSYVVIHCHLNFNSTDIVGTASTDGEIYVPYDGSFEAGYHYKTSMTFGLGYDKDGKTYKPTVTLTTRIVPWTIVTDNNDGKQIYPEIPSGNG